MSELMDRYNMLKRELIRVRDEYRLYGHKASHRECCEEDKILDEMDLVWYKMSDAERKELDGGWDYCCGSLNYMAREISEVVRSKGFETTWWDVPEKLMLVVTELAEAMEEYRHLGRDEMSELGLNQSVRKMSPEGVSRVARFSEEIADAVIRLLNIAASLGIDIELEIATKMAKNVNRPYRHGGKNC